MLGISINHAYAEAVCGIAQATVPSARAIQMGRPFGTRVYTRSDPAPLCPAVVFLIDKAGIVGGFGASSQ